MPSDSLREFLTAARELAEKATKGPWNAVLPCPEKFYPEYHFVEDHKHRRLFAEPMGFAESGEWGNGDGTDDDFVFAAAARTDVPRLVAISETLLARLLEERVYVRDTCGSECCEDIDAALARARRIASGEETP